MTDLGKTITIIGFILVAIGLWMWFGPKMSWLGRLPGDIAIEKSHFRFYFPLATCLLISLILTLLFWLFRKH